MRTKKYSGPGRQLEDQSVAFPVEREGAARSRGVGSRLSIQPWCGGKPHLTRAADPLPNILDPRRHRVLPVRLPTDQRRMRQLAACARTLPDIDGRRARRRSGRHSPLPPGSAGSRSRCRDALGLSAIVTRIASTTKSACAAQNDRKILRKRLFICCVKLLAAWLLAPG